MHGERWTGRQREGGREVGGGSCRQTRRAAIIATRFALCNMNNFARKLFLILTPVEAAHSLKLRLDPAPHSLPSSCPCHSTAVGGCGQPRAKAQGMQGQEVRGGGKCSTNLIFYFTVYSLPDSCHKRRRLKKGEKGGLCHCVMRYVNWARMAQLDCCNTATATATTTASETQFSRFVCSLIVLRLR